LNRGRIDFEPAAGRHDDGREDRVVRNVLRALEARHAPRAGLADAILSLGPAAIAAAAALVLATRVVAGPGTAEQLPPPTVGTALGMPAAVERVIRSPDPASGWELLTAFQEER
jgi:hypothetical protein